MAPFIPPPSMTTIKSFGRKSVNKQIHDLKYKRASQLDKIEQEMDYIGCKWRPGIGASLEAQLFDSKACKNLKKKYWKTKGKRTLSDKLLIGFGRRRRSRARRRSQSRRRRSRRRSRKGPRGGKRYIKPKGMTCKEFLKRKISTNMREFKAGRLRSSSGTKVTNRKQVLAISYSQVRAGNPSCRRAFSR